MGVYGDNGKENGNYYGFRPESLSSAANALPSTKSPPRSRNPSTVHGLTSAKVTWITQMGPYKDYPCFKGS